MSKPIDQEREAFALIPVERSYNMRAAAIMHFNTARQEGKDLDDALNAAWRATLSKAHSPDDGRAAVQPAGVAVPSTAEYGEAVKRLFELDADAKKYCAEHWLLTIFKWTVGRVCEINSVAVQHPVSGEQTVASVSIGVDTLKWWRQLIDLNPADLAPRLDAALAAHRAQQGERKPEPRPAWLDGGAEAVAMAKEDEANAVAGLVDALEQARMFIRNGIDLGVIRMPDADTPDSAHATLPKIDVALAAYREWKGERP